MERVEYRDEHGNILDEDQVKALEGKVSFSTKYETRTRVLDKAGNEIADVIGEPEGEDSFAGTLAEAQEPSSEFEGKPSAEPPIVNVAADLKKEAKVDADAASPQQAEPEGDASAATGKDEL